MENFDQKSVIEMKYNNDHDTLGTMLEMQKELQNHFQEKRKKNNPNFPDVNNMKTLGEIYDFINFSMMALQDEYREVVDALPGTHTFTQKERSALWKIWKSKNKEMRERKLSDLSPEELQDLKFEVCDMFHLFMNIMLAIGMTSKDMYECYMIKNTENKKRCSSDY